LQNQNMKQLQSMEQITYQTKNKNEKLQRVVVEKEATLLELQNENARLSNELKNTRESKDV